MNHSVKLYLKWDDNQLYDFDEFIKKQDKKKFYFSNMLSKMSLISALLKMNYGKNFLKVGRISKKLNFNIQSSLKQIIIQKIR